MTSYRPSYGNPCDYPPPPGAMPPLPRGPPPSYDQQRRGDFYRPPQTDFSFRNSDRSHFPQGHIQENGQSRPRNNHHDNKNLNQARRGRTYKPRAAYRAAPADRPLLRHHDQAGSTEQMLGMANGQKFMAAEDISDSDEEQMVESDSGPDADQSHTNDVDLVDKPMATDDGQPAEESLEPASKRRALTSISQNSKDAASEPKWSNPDPYTVLPPLDEQRKRKDVVKLIRKSRKEAEGSASELNQVAANDDFISFGMENGEVSPPPSPSLNEQDDIGGGVPGAPSAPRSFSHLQNLHGQDLDSPDQRIPTSSLGPPPSSAQALTRLPEEVVLDTSQTRSNSHTRFGPRADEALGNRKRTHDDNIKGQKKGASLINGSILYDWVPPPSTNPTPWLRKTGMLTANAGFRLHKEICDFYDFVKPQHFEQIVRQELLSRLQSLVVNEIPHATVLCFGSFAAGMYLPNADMDVVIVSNSFRTTGHKVICQTRNQIWRFHDFIRDSKFGTSVEAITGAKVPLVKFVDRVTGIRVDVSFENDTGILANETFASWKIQYPAMPVLVTVIKQFLMMRGLNEVVHGGLGGFSVTCLVTSLLQNMPRVQSGELVPEQHLGEMLIEFLDFYGNRLDASRTGIMMRPPGYFEKNVRQRNQPSQSVYQVHKPDRLAIMDPNKEHNDISGGSRLVMLIFERFSHAHAEILRAMKTPGRISLLDWSLGGSYDSFTFQRNRLRELYGNRQGVLGDIPDQNHVVQMAFRGEAEPLNEAPAAVANRPKGDAVPESEVDTKLSSVNGKKVPNKAGRADALRQKQADRAAALKKKYPDMEGIPARIGHGTKAKLISNYRAGHGRSTEAVEPALSIAPSNGSLTAKTAQLTKPTRKGQARARTLKKEYPGMSNIPNSIRTNEVKKLIKDHLSRKPANLPPTYLSQNPQALPPNPLEKVIKHVAPSGKGSAGLAQMPQHSSYPADQRQLMNPPTRQILHHQQNTGKSMSNKMAPLSDERRAEVARNLEGTSNDDPINLD